MTYRWIAAALATLILTPAAAAAEDLPDITNQPINCSTAEGDIRALNSEKDYARDQVVRNVASVTPAGALFGLVTGTEGKRLQILSGRYSELIDERIAAIQSECNL